MNQLLRRRRRANLLSQEELADRVGVSAVSIRRWESGHRPQPVHLRRLCEELKSSPSDLGFVEEGLDAGSSGPLLAIDRDSTIDPALAHPTNASVVDSHQEWRRGRHYFKQHRVDLTWIAAGLYSDAARISPRSPLIASPSWIPSELVPLSDVDLNWVEGRLSQTINGGEPEAEPYIPLRARNHRYSSYSSAIRYLDRPSLFENRPSYRFLDVSWHPPLNAQFSFGLATYFEKIDVSEVLGHELAVQAMQLPRARLMTASELWRHLPYRNLVGTDDPFDAMRRPILMAISTLTLRRSRRDGSARFMLHWRDPAKVAVGGGLYSVVPVGEFQPSSLSPWDQLNDFDLWRNMVREFSEEYLGTPEHDGSLGAPINYEAWPLYRRLAQARHEHQLEVFCLGVGLDPLTLGGDILTVVVMDDDVFDEVFEGIVATNAEGVMVESGEAAMQGAAFTGPTIDHLLTAKPIAPDGAACLDLAWRHRSVLLGR